jgi:hypothetical protein
VIRTIDIRELARALLPHTSRHKVIALLSAFFDETGIHAGAPVTFVAGFIGTDDQWAKVCDHWDVEMNGEVFHYKTMCLEEERLDRLAVILASSELQVIAAGFCGDWNKAISHKPDWKNRFPSCYHFALETCVDQMDQWAAEGWNSEPIALMFSRQNEYAKRAEEIWRTFRGNGLWNNFVSFAYGDPETVLQLQPADMIAYETFQCMQSNAAETCQKWPLVKRLLAKGAPLLGNYMTTESFIQNMEESDRKGRIILKTVPKPSH